MYADRHGLSNRQALSDSRDSWLTGRGFAVPAGQDRQALLPRPSRKADSLCPRHGVCSADEAVGRHGRTAREVLSQPW